MEINKITNFAKKFANLQVALTLLFIIGAVIAIGTIIEQDQPLNFYKEAYPEVTPLFGVLSWKVIKFLNLDQIYTCWWFVLLLIFFVISLLSCTFTTQIPSLKTFKIWRFYQNPEQFKKFNINNNLNLGFFNSFAYSCNTSSYHFFRQKNKGYSYSGLLGRLAPVIVHFSITFLLFGSISGLFSGYTAQEFVPRGEISHIQNLVKFGKVSTVPQDLSFRVNDFWIKYTSSSKIEQFYSDLSVLNNDGQEIKRKTIFVNEPLIFKDTTFYQTDWDIVGIKLQLPNNKNFQIPLKKVVKEGRSFWFGTVPLEKTIGQKITIILNNLNGQLFLYDSRGNLITQSLIGDLIQLDKNIEIKFVDVVAVTGLQIKSDPGIVIVYFSFLLLMVSITISFFTYSQIWLMETPRKILVGGNSNRSVLFFQQEFRQIVNQIQKTDKTI